MSKDTTMKIIGSNIAFVVQKKSTPFRKPRNNGGSPSGVNDPPIFATKKIKIQQCVLYVFDLYWL